MGMEIVNALEGTKFALRKLEDIESSEAAALSGATALSGVSSEMQSIKNMLGQFHQVLMDNSQANWEDSKNSTDPNVQISTKELQDVARCIETAFVIFKTTLGTIKPGTLPQIFKTINPKPVNFFALHKLKADFGKIKSQIGKINIGDLGAPSNRDITQPARRSLRNIVDTWLLGLEIYRKCILRRLVDQSLQTRSVVQVVGTKMFAKTVLAEKIYQSTEVKTHFEACFWLFPQIGLVPDDGNCGWPHRCLFKPIDILRKMLLKLGDTNLLDAHGEDYHIMSRLRQSLNDKRCLVVVDNNWTELWTLVNAAFPDGNNGSRVLITTQEQGQSDYKYELPFLNYQDSLKLLKELGTNDFKEFEDERTILNMDDENQWYSKLPGVLKTCFAYTAAVFPCGSIVLADSLIRLWIVEGLIPQEEGRTMEIIAESYLDQLVQRGLLRIFEAYYHNQANHPIRSIILHPSLHNVFNSRTKKNSFESFDPGFGQEEYIPVIVSGCETYPEVASKRHQNFHRWALHQPYQFNQISSFEKVHNPKQQGISYPYLHSLFFFSYVAPVASPDQLSFLRVLAVFSSHIRFPEEDTPCWLDGLINLRYLGFIVCLVEGRSLGKTLDRLGNLEILDLSASIVSGLSEFIKDNKKVNVVLGPVKEELPESWSPVPDMSQ